MKPYIGQKCGKRVIVEILPSTGRGVRVLLECQCGNRSSTLFRQAVKTTSCTRCTALYIQNTYISKHGKAGTKVYRAWKAMKTRVSNPNIECYRDYGGRGITIDPTWDASFDAFYADMGDPPSSKHSLDRIDVNGDYCKENCKWSNPQEQARNTRKNVDYFGKTAAEWRDILQIPYSFIVHRLREGRTIQSIQEEWDRGNYRIYKGRMYIDGILVTEWADSNNIPYDFVKYRVKKGKNASAIKKDFESYILRKNKKPK